MADRHKKCSTSLINKELQIKTTVSFHLAPVRKATINKQTTTGVGGDEEKRKAWCPVGEIVNWYIHYGKQYGNPSKN